MEYKSYYEWESDPNRTNNDYVSYRGVKVLCDADFGEHYNYTTGLPIDSWFEDRYCMELDALKGKDAEHAEIATLGVLASDVELRERSFLWYPYFPNDTINILGGTAGTGKTWFLFELIRAVTTGDTDGLPYGHLDRYGNVVYISVEQDKYESRRRLRTVGADISKVLIIDGKCKTNSPELIKTLLAFKPVLVIFDPIMAYFPKGKSYINYADVQDVVLDLVSLIRSIDSCCIAVVHPPKNNEYHLGQRYTGSGGFTDIARTATYIGYHPTEPTYRVGFQTKNNFEETEPFVYEMDKEIYPVIWHGIDSSITAKDIENAERILTARNSGTMELYGDVIESVFKVNPKGFEMRTSEIINTYDKLIERPSGINSHSFGMALKSDEFRQYMQKNRAICIRNGKKPKGYQHYAVYGADLLNGIGE